MHCIGLLCCLAHVEVDRSRVRVAEPDLEPVARQLDVVLQKRCLRVCQEMPLVRHWKGDKLSEEGRKSCFWRVWVNEP